MDAPEPIEQPYDSIVELRYDRDADQWRAKTDGVEVVFEPGVQPNRPDFRAGLAAVNRPQHLN